MSMLRNARQTKILEIIDEQEIETQIELCEALEKARFKVTQATVSRDVRELGLFKVAGVEKRYRYTAVRRKEGDLSDRMRALFESGVEFVQAIGNLVVTSTITGYGANAGAVIDQLGYSEIVGSIAGDDTVLSICRTPEDAEEVRKKLSAIARG